MDARDINFLVSILKQNNKQNLANLLEGCSSAVIGSDQYGTRAYSILSTFVIYVPLDKYQKLKGLTREERHAILESVLDLYPLEDNAPEINSISFRILREDTREGMPQQYLGKSIRVFLSYSSEDKDLIGSIKLYLEKYGLEVFIAHEDIKPSLEWQGVILENLDSTDIFIPIITDNFSNSAWTDQESGIALAKNKSIIPVSINGNMPYGFLNKYQALKFRTDNMELSCHSIIKIILDNPRFTQALTNSLIKTLPNIWSFDEAGNKFSILSQLSFDEEQINEVIKCAIGNIQIHDSRTAKPNLLSLARKYKSLIANDMLGQLSVKVGVII